MEETFCQKQLTTEADNPIEEKGDDILIIENLDNETTNFGHKVNRDPRSSKREYQFSFAPDNN